MDCNGALEAWRVHCVNNLWINQAPLAIPIQPTIFLGWEYCSSQANHCSITGEKYNHVKIGRCEERRVQDFYQILMDSSGSELQLGGEVNSKGAPLENAELSQIWHVEKQTYSGRHSTKKSNFTWIILLLNWDLFIFPLLVETDSTLIAAKTSPWSW